MKDDKTRHNLNKESSEFVPSSIQELTRGETEVLKFMAIGNNVKEISGKLGILESTIKNHKTRIFEKLYARNTSDAIFTASKQNII